MSKRMFSGVQPSGSIHIGNYLGAIKHWIAAQSVYESFFCIVDLHAITVVQNPVFLKNRIHETAGLLLAAGIDPNKSSLFVQSTVSAHAELAWILNCFIPMGWMMRMTQFKDRPRNKQKQVNVGLFDYPALMVADILLYQTDLVTVGSDQKQHVELTRDIAKRFNSLYDGTFSIPEPVIPSVGGRIMGLSDPTKKMSKSEIQEHQVIYLLDSPDDIHAKIIKAAKDSFHDIRFDENRPGITNLLVIYELFTGLNRSEIESRFTGKNDTQLKNELADLIAETLGPIQKKYKELCKDSSLVESFLKKGSLKARIIAKSTLRLVKERIGLG